MDAKAGPERLAQIAHKKLAQLGLPTRLPEGARLAEGVLAFRTGRVRLPGADTPLARAPFRTEGHDALRFTEPPLAALGPVPFHDLESTAALEERVEKRLRERLAALEPQRAALARLKLPLQLDPGALAVRASVAGAAHTFDLLATPDAVRVVRVTPARGAPLDVPEPPALRLADFDGRVDLEVHLEDLAERLKAAARAAAPPPAARSTSGVTQVPSAAALAPTRVEPQAAPAGALTLGQLVDAFGRDAFLGSVGALELAQDFVVGGQRYRLLAARVEGATFNGRLGVPGAGERWSERFDVTRLSGTEALVRKALGLGTSAPAAAPAPSLATGAEHPDHLLPRPGERWVMNVLIEREGPDEVRYVCTNVEGQPYGASRVLTRKDFEAAFVRASGGACRLTILVESVEGDAVSYRQLDASGVPRGSLRRVAMGVLVTTFVPEETAY